MYTNMAVRMQNFWVSRPDTPQQVQSLEEDEVVVAQEQLVSLAATKRKEADLEAGRGGGGDCDGGVAQDYRTLSVNICAIAEGNKKR